MLRPTALAVLLCARLAAAQTKPDEAWAPAPVVPSITSAPTTALTPPPLPAPGVSGENVSRALPPLSGEYTFATARPRPVDPPNQTSMVGAPTLGPGHVGAAFEMGFPVMGLRAAVGVSDAVDLGVGFDTFYGTMNEFRLTSRLALLRGSAWSISATLEASGASFTLDPAAEVHGARYLTGRRNWNVNPGVRFSWQPPTGRSTRLVIEADYLLTIDTQPYSFAPLSGVPASFSVGHNVNLRVGGEVPLSLRTSFVFALGLMFHGRAEDALALPQATVGLVTGW
jgi:hypothetical protein